MSRSTGAWQALLLLAALSTVGVRSAPVPWPLRAHPNIILILADDLGYGDLGCYGQKRIQTPNLDALAAEGMRFTRCYAGSPVCAPSRAVLMTGLHTGHVSLRGNAPVPLQTNEVTVAEVLRGAGYETGCIGKWALGSERTAATPSRKGFNEWLGYLNQTAAHNYYPANLWRSSKDASVEDMQLPLPGNVGGAKGVYAPDLFLKAATNFIRGVRLRPFFLYFPSIIPHANNELKEKGMEIPSDEPYAKEDWPQPEKNKAAMITRLDRDVGVLMAQLKAMGVDSNTMVCFTSDNGPHREGGVKPEFFQSAGPWRGAKRDLYEGGIRVPLLVRWPGRVPAGVVSDETIAFWDLLPTFAEAAGLKAPDGLDGVSMLSTFLGGASTNQHPALYWEFHEGASQQAVVLGDWKGVRLRPDGPLHLYDLKSDPGETNDVAAVQPEVVRRLEAHLKNARTSSERWPLKP